MNVLLGSRKLASMPAAGTTAAPAAGTTAAPAAGLLSFYLLTYTLVTAISQLPNKFIIIIITDISKRTINDKLSQRRAWRQSNQTTKSSVFSFCRNISIVRAGSRNADVSEFQDKYNTSS